MNREEIANVTTAKHALHVQRHREQIASAPDVLAARTRFQDAVRSLPGVATDPDTVPNVMLLADMLVQRKEQLDERGLFEAAAWLILRMDMALMDEGIHVRTVLSGDHALRKAAMEAAGHRLSEYEREAYYG